MTGTLLRKTRMVTGAFTTRVANMTISGSIELTCLYDLTPPALKDDNHHFHVFSGVASAAGFRWAYGSNVLLLSRDGTHWQDLGGKLNLSGAFAVSAVVDGEDGAFVLARSKDGLHCFHFLAGTWECTELPSLPTSSAGALVVKTTDALLACIHERETTDFLRFRDSQRIWERLPAALPGVPIHLELSESGTGICALWGILREDGVALPAPSAVYQTRDFGVSWSLIQELDTMLLAGACAPGRLSLLGGSDGCLAEGTVAGFTRCYQGSVDDVVAVSSERSQQAVILESFDEPSRQTLLWRSTSPEWELFEVGLTERVQGVHFIGFGVILLCTQHLLFAARIQIVQ